MRVISLFTFLLVLFISCGRKDRMPNDILAMEKMREVMWDMMRADQFLTDYVLLQDTSLKRKDESIGLYREILALHQVTQEEFRESFYYYRARPELMKIMMDSLSRKPLLAIDTTIPKLAIDTTNPGVQNMDTSKSIKPRERIDLQ